MKTANLADIFTSRLLSEIPPALTYLLSSLLSLPNLTTINLSDNAFGLKTVGPLVDFLKAHTPLQHLILNNNGLGPFAGIEVANALSELLDKKEQAKHKGTKVPDLETVICGRNRLENGSMEAWAKVFRNHKGIKTVKMVQNGIRQPGITEVLSNGFRNSTALEVLDLEDNTFTAPGSTALASILPNLANLRELGVGDCLLKHKGASEVFRTIARGSNSKIEVLRLQYNGVNAEGLETLVSSIKAGKLPALRRVELNGNKFAEEDASLLALKEILAERKAKATGTPEDKEDEDDEDNEEDTTWGLDELDDLDDEEDESDEEEEEADEDEDEQEKVIHEADQAENENVAQEQDEDVDSIAKRLGETLI
jgi:Ran GTPase-activating protein 1